jgi:hypothetical protein
MRDYCSFLSFLDCIAFTGNTWRVGGRGLFGLANLLSEVFSRAG